MSQENVEIVRHLYGLWPDRVSAAEEFLQPDVVIDIPEIVLTPALYRGFDGVRRFLVEWRRSGRTFELNPGS
jgi:hypothetical protein